MKSIFLMLTLILTFSLCNTIIPENALAKSDTKEAVTTVEKKAAAKKSTRAIVKDVNINTADKELLTQLPGVGPVTADAILKYRKSIGSFKSIDDLTNVKGIGNKTLAKLKPYLQKV